MIPFISPDHRVTPLTSRLASQPWKEVETCSPDLLKYFFGESLGAEELTGEKIPQIIQAWSSFFGEDKEAESLLHDFQDIQECARRSTEELLAHIHERLRKRGRFCLAFGAQEAGKRLFASAIIEKREDGHLYVHIVKPWGGDDLHPTVALAGERKKRSYRYYPIRLKNDDFFKPKGKGEAAARRLLETVREYSAASPDQIQNVYQLFVQVGEVRRGEEILDPRLGVKLKAGGGSLEQLFSMLLKEALGNDPQAYKKSMLAFKYGLLKGAWESYKKDPSLAKGDLFKLCKRQFSNRLAKGGEEGWLSSQERTMGLDLCDDIDAYFAETPIEVEEPAPSPLLRLPSMLQAPFLRAEGRVVKYSPTLGIEKPPQGCISPLNGREFTPENILGDLDLFFNWLKQEKQYLTKEEANALHVESTLHLLQRLPIPIDEKGRQFWAAIPDQEVSVAVTKLTDVMYEGMKSVASQEQLRSYYQEVMLASMSVYAITDALCRRIPALRLEGINTIPSNFSDPVDDNFRFESAWKQKQYEALHAHFKAQPSQTPSLFSLILEATRGEDFRKAFVDWRENKQNRDKHFDSLFTYLVQFEAPDPSLSDELLLQRYLEYMVEEVTKEELEEYKYTLINETPRSLLAEWDKEKDLDKQPTIDAFDRKTILEEKLPGRHEQAFYRLQRLHFSCLGVAQLQNPHQSYLSVFKGKLVRLYYRKEHKITASKRYQLMRVDGGYRGPRLKENPERTTITKTDEKRALHYEPWGRDDFWYWSHKTKRFPGVLDVRISPLLGKIQGTSYDWHTPTENRDLLASAKDLPFPQEVLQALYLLKDFPDTRAGGLLQFIELYPDAASLPDVQEVIGYFLFEPGFLEAAMKKNPQFSQDIQGVIDRQIQRYANPYEYEKALTWMRLAHRSAVYLLKEQNRDAYLIQRKKLDQMIVSMEAEIGALQAKDSSFACTAFYECILHRLFLQIEEPYTFDPQQAGKLYGFWMALKMQDQGGACLRENIPLAVSLYVHKYYEKFAPLLQGEEFEKSFYRHLGEYFQGISGIEGIRKTDFGSYQSSNGNYVFDLFLGHCYENNVRIQKGKWPEALLTSAREHFPSSLPTVRRIAGGVEGTVEPFRLRKGSEGEVLYERRIDPASSHYWKLLKEEEVMRTSLHKSLWQGKQCWVSPLGDIWVTNEKLEPEYKVLQAAQGAIIRASDGKRLFDPLQSSIQGWIRSIWEVSDVLLWGKSLEPDELVIPKLDNLTLSIEQQEGSLVITSPHYHGYVAAQNQDCPELGGMRGVLVFEKEDEPDKRLLLVPCQALKSENSLQPPPPEVVHQRLAPSTKHQTNLFTYEVDELRGVLRPIYGDRTAAKLYLIDIFLREKDYEKADFYIEDLLLDYPFTKEDQTILNDIIINAPLDAVASSLVIRLMLRLTQDKVFFKHREEEVEVWLWTGRLIDHFRAAMSVPSLREAGDVSKDWRLSHEEKERCLKYLVNKFIIKEEEFTHFWNQIHHQGMETAVKTLQFLPGKFSLKPLKLEKVDAFSPKPKAPSAEKAELQVEEPKPFNGCRTVVTEDTFVEDFQLLYRLARKARNEYPPEFDLAILPYLRLSFGGELKPFFELLLRVRENPTGFPETMDPNSYVDIYTCNSRLSQPAVNIRVKPPLQQAPYQLSGKENRLPPEMEVDKVEVLKGSQVYQKGERPLGELVDSYFSPETKYLVEPGTPFPLSPLPHASQMVRDQLQRLAAAHEENMKKPVQVFAFKPEDSERPQLKSALLSREQYLKSERTRLKGDIERLANTRGKVSGDKERLKFHAKTLPGLRLETGIFEAIIAQDAHHLQTLNPFLDDTQAQKIYDDTLRYMLTCSEYDQVKAAIEELKNDHLQDCATILNRIRKYSPSEHPLLLAYEYATGNMLREEPDQATLLLKIFSVVFEEEPSADKQEKLRRLFFEFQAGGGKTKVIAAILAAAAIHKGKMPVFISLPEIYDVAKEDFRETLERVYRQKVDAIDLHLGSNPSLQELRTYHRQCKRGLKEKRGQIMTPESYHVLVLSLEKALKEGRLNKIKKISKILRFYRQHAIFLIDESHRTVDSLLQANLALGNPRPLPPDQQELFLKVYDLLLQNPRLQLRANQQALASDAEKKVAILGFAGTILRNWGIYSKELLEIVTKLDVDPSDIERHPDRKELLYLLRGICTEILPHAFAQVERMDHGPSIHPGNPLDGPRRFKNPSKAQFESVDVACTLTIQGYYHRGLQSYEDLRQLVERMKQEFAYQKQQVTDFKTLPVYQDFLNWQEGIDPSLRMTLDRVDDRFLQDRSAVMKLQSSLGKNQEAIRYFLKNYVLPRTMVFPYKYTSTAQELVAGAYSCVLFSATLGPQEQNPFVETSEQFGEDLTFQAHVVQRGCMPHNSTVRWVEDKGPYALLEELYAKGDFSNCEGITNLGGFSKHTSNEEWARVWLQFAKDRKLSCKAALFKQEEPAPEGEIGEKVFYLWKQGEAKPDRLSTTDILKELRQRGLKLEEVAKIFGPDDTTGTDMPLSRHAKMILTMGEGTTSSALIQAIMRERLFLKAPFNPDESQSIIWVGTPSLKAKIEEVIHEEVKSTHEIFSWAFEQQAKRETVAILANGYQEIRGIYRQVALESMIEMEPTEASRLFNEVYLNLFEEDLTRDLQKLYGASLREVEVKGALNAFAESLNTKYSLDNPVLHARVQEVIQRISRKVQKVTLASQKNLSNTAQQQQVNVQVQIKVAEAKQQKAADVPFDKVVPGYDQSRFSLTSDVFWDPRFICDPRYIGCTKTLFDDLLIMPNACFIDDQDTYCKPPSRLLLLGEKKGEEWEYHCRLVSLADAKEYQREMLEKTLKPTQRVALLTLTGHLECRAMHSAIPEDDLKRMVEDPGFQRLLTYVHLRNGKVYNEKILREMIRQAPTEMRREWSEIKKRILDKNRIQDMLIERLFEESAPAILDVTTEIAVEEGKKDDENSSSLFNPPAPFTSSLDTLEDLRKRGLKREKEERVDYVARKTHDLFFTRGWLRFLNRLTFGIVGFFIRRHYRKKWDASV